MFMVQGEKNFLHYSRKEMVDALSSKWSSIRSESKIDRHLSVEQFRDLARTETDDELLFDCYNSASNEGISLSEFMDRYV